MELRLSPSGHLSWVASTETEDSPPRHDLQEAFARDWREGLFLLGAEKVMAPHALTARFWREFAEHFLTALCHANAKDDTWELPPPEPFVLDSLVLSAPPMQGGEYLSQALLSRIWEELEAWVRETVEDDDLTGFLQKRAPLWNQVGLVCFHLAENKKDPDHPFAFLATYAKGLGATGQVKHVPLGRALQEYAGANNRTRLRKLLEPVHKASQACDWVRELVQSKAIYKPSAWTANQAYEFLRSIPELEASGLSVRVPDWWKKRPRARVSVTLGEDKPTSLNLAMLLRFNVKVALGDQLLDPDELQELLAMEEEGLVFFKEQWVEVDKERLQEALDHWESIEKSARQGELTLIEGMRLLSGASTDLQHEAVTEEEREWVHIQASEALQATLAKLRDPSRLDAPSATEKLQATLRHYQEEGVAWLTFLSSLGLGACLADDMGLGKTIQVLALLLHYQQAPPPDGPQPSLLVVPASLLGNWKQEAERFAPSLTLTFLHPSETSREQLQAIAADPSASLQHTDLAVTTYAMLSRQDWLQEQEWNLAILDEAQAIKNPGTRQSKAARKLSARSRIALTGTPVENRLGDLWALFDFINPGLLGSPKVFKSFVKQLQGRPTNQFAPLRRLVSPYILRRLKTDPTVVSDLPDKIETQTYCALTQPQVKLYQRIVKEMKDALYNADGMARRGLVLQSLMRFKQLCNHPSQVTGDGDFDPKHSGKFQRLGAICDELAARQEKVLIFTQFREIIDPLALYLAEVFGREGLVLHGGTSVKKRKAIVQDFQSEQGPPFFLLSLKAGGTGLNLTAANHVVHFDRWWNPAVENQATDRAFRIGQQRNVLVHKFVTQGTVEERIDQMLQEKQKLADEILADSEEVNLTELSDDQLLDLVRLDVTRAKL